MGYFSKALRAFSIESLYSASNCSFKDSSAPGTTRSAKPLHVICVRPFVSSCNWMKPREPVAGNPR